MDDRYRIDFLGSVVDMGLALAKHQRVDIYTVAFYLDHESHAVSLCIDTLESSTTFVRRGNAKAREFFVQALERGDIQSASRRWANAGRSLSLGDFAVVNAGREDLGHIPQDSSLILDMVRVLESRRNMIAGLSTRPSEVLLASSTLHAEVGLVWSLGE